MKVELARKVAYTDVDGRFRMKPRALMRLLQEAAVVHSERVGVPSSALVASGSVWILNKIALEVRRWPAHREALRIVTWHRGSRGFRAYRDFRVYADGTCVADAASLWLYFDLETRRLRRVPAALGDAYTVESDTAGPFDLDAWKPPVDDPPEVEMTITTRAGDYDPLGHVNNTAYFDFVDTLAVRAAPAAGAIRRLAIHFQREIGPEVDRIVAGWTPTAAGGRFRLTGGADVHAAGEIAF